MNRLAKAGLITFAIGGTFMMPLIYAVGYFFQTFGEDCMTAFIKSGAKVGTAYLIVMDESKIPLPTDEILSSIPVIANAKANVYGTGSSKGRDYDLHIDRPNLEKPTFRRLLDISSSCVPLSYSDEISLPDAFIQSYLTSMQCLSFKAMNAVFPFPDYSDCLALDKGTVKKENERSFRYFCSKISTK